jgi:hypothetical protein
VFGTGLGVQQIGATIDGVLVSTALPSVTVTAIAGTVGHEDGPAMTERNRLALSSKRD